MTFEVTVAGFNGSLNSTSTIELSGLFRLFGAGDARTMIGAVVVGSGAMVNAPLYGLMRLPNVSRASFVTNTWMVELGWKLAAGVKVSAVPLPEMVRSPSTRMPF